MFKRLVVSHLSGPKPAKPILLNRLSPREREVFKLVGSGATNSEIARTLFISETTVKTHIARTQVKLGARDRIQLVVLAHRANLV